MFKYTFTDLLTNIEDASEGSVINDPLQDYDGRSDENSHGIRIKHEKEQAAEINGCGIRRIDRPAADKMENCGVPDENHGKISRASAYLADDDFQSPIDGPKLLSGMKSNLRAGTSEDSNHSQITSEDLEAKKRGMSDCHSKVMGVLDGTDINHEHDIEILDDVEVGIEVISDEAKVKKTFTELFDVVSENVEQKKQNNENTWYNSIYSCFNISNRFSRHQDNTAFSNRMRSGTQEKGGIGTKSTTQRTKTENMAVCIEDVIENGQQTSNKYFYTRTSNTNAGIGFSNKQYAKMRKKENRSSREGLKFNRNQTVSSGNSKIPENSPGKDVLTQDFVIETLGDALNCFKLKERLNTIEMNLEKVRKRQKLKEEHKSDLNRFDKEVQKLSFKYHPDKVINRGGSDKEMAAAQKLQTALNTTRTVLKVLGEAFLEDIDTDHRYVFYENLSITSLGNEEDIKSHVKRVVLKISYLSDIKQQSIIAEICQFLQEARNCVKWCLEDKGEKFESCRILAMSHFEKCIEGFEKLIAEFVSVKEDFRSERNNDIALRYLQKMSNKSCNLLTALKNLQKFVNGVPKGRCRFYRPDEEVDDYFVLPFVCYMNVIVMCSAVFKNRPHENWRKFVPSMGQEYFCYSPTENLNYPYYLASVYSGCKLYKDIVAKRMGERSEDREEIRKEFLTGLQEANLSLAERFRSEHYSAGNTRANLFMDEYLRCMTMIADFRRKEKELRCGIEQINTKTQEIEDKYAIAMMESEEVISRLKDRLERSRLQREQVSASLGKEMLADSKVMD